MMKGVFLIAAAGVGAAALLAALYSFGATLVHSRPRRRRKRKHYDVRGPDG